MTSIPTLPRPRQPVFLETFLIDQTEVTVDAYEAYLAESGAAQLPEQCGYEDHDRPFPDERFEWIPEVSGMDETRADHPVICVTRAEAAAFCAAGGGRLPTVAEWMRAGQEPYPAFRRFPWGDAPPPPDEIEWISANFREFYAEYLACALPLSELGTAPVGSRPRGVSPTGVFDLAGNASELLSDCADGLVETYGHDPEPLVRPARPDTPQCADAVLVGGANWRSHNVVDLEGSQTVWSMVDGEDGFSPVEGDRDVGAISTGLDAGWMWGFARQLDDTTPSDGAGNERRSWRIGFRCAYDP
jgi:formylglycine-generating enzyme required for sulfatase activity